MSEKRNNKIKSVMKIVNNYIKKLEKDGITIKEVYLFGSTVKGKVKRFSDIDIAVVSPDFKDKFKAMKYLWNKRDAKDIQYGIEPLPFTPEEFSSSDPLVYEILTSGIKITTKTSKTSNKTKHIS